MTSQAIVFQDEADAFGRSIRHCHNLISIHSERNTAQGRRYQEVSLNRAVVVLAVAAWQTLVQDLVLGALATAEPSGTATVPEIGTYRLIKAQIEREVRKFATPNTQNTRDLLDTVGLDIKPHWTWEVPARGRSQSRTRTFAEISRELDDWLAVRHAIAHGHKQIPRRLSLDAILTKYASDQKKGLKPQPNNYPAPEIRKADAERCARFIHQLSQVTTFAMVGVVSGERPKWPRWRVSEATDGG